MRLPEWLENLPVCPECGLHYYEGNGFRLHIEVITDANGCIRLHYHVACEQVTETTEPNMAEVY
jgi:hypothetical protein